MKKIIVPVDYSEVSDTSIEFAKALCRTFHARLNVISCWRPHIEAEMGVGLVHVESEKIHKERLHHFLKKHQLDKNDGKLLIGLPGDIITDLAKKEDTLMIVMGTAREYGLLEKVIGGVASYVIKNARCPVMLIPPKVKVDGNINNIMVAGEMESTDRKSLQQIINYTKQFNAKVAFANVSSFEQKGKGLHISDTVLEEITKREDIGISFSVVDIYSSSVEQGLNNHCKHNDIDLLIFVTRKHRWWESLLNNTNSIDPEKVAIDMHRPILVFRIDE